MTSALKPPKIPRMGCPLGVGLMVLIAVEIAIYLSLSLKVQLSVGDAALHKLDEQHCKYYVSSVPIFLTELHKVHWRGHLGPVSYFHLMSCGLVVADTYALPLLIH